jgi:ferredoxin
MDSVPQRRVGDLVIRIDRTLCVGFGDCIESAPDVFQFDDEGIASFRADAAATRERLLDACRACPVDALTALDEDGAQLAP